MRKSGGLFILLGVVAALYLHLPMELRAQDAEKSEVASSEEGTIVTSSRFRLDLEKKEGVFSGEVQVKDADFDMTAEELIAFFDENNQVERLVARGNVNLSQGGKRSATCREAEYLVEDGSLRLTGDPVVTQEGNQITGTVIKIFPDGDRMEVDGRSKVQFFLD